MDTIINSNNIKNIIDIKNNIPVNDMVEAMVVKGMSEDRMLEYISIFTKGLGLEPPEEDLLSVVTKARFQIQKMKKNLTGHLREWIDITSGIFSISDLYQNISFISSEDRPYVTVIMNRLIKEGMIERVGKKNGVYRKVENEVEIMDIFAAQDEPLDLWLPLGLHKLVYIMPGNVILVAGAPDAGKTAFLLNIVAGNQEKFDMHYFNSEMGVSELKQRLLRFDLPLETWKFTPYERASNFADVVKSGKGIINIIDFLEIYDNFYEIGGMINEIHQKLDGAIAVIAIQKPPGRDEGRGGGMTLEKPRLALAMDHGVTKITKGKNWVDPRNNPRHQQIRYKMYNGCKFSVNSEGWHHASGE